MDDLPRRGTRRTAAGMVDVGRGERRVRAGWRTVACPGADAGRAAGGARLVRLVHYHTMHRDPAAADARALFFQIGISFLSLAIALL